MNRAKLKVEAAEYGLFLMGHLHDAGDTVILLGADTGMWPVFQASAEYSDGATDPLDRWSKRVFAVMAATHGATCVFPSDGPPYAPFIAWAQATGRFWQSPTGMLIHDRAGLMISIRGALRFPELLPLEQTQGPSPCETCDTKPCTQACPVNALNGETFYDVPVCKSHLGTPDGHECMTGGCLVRQICPVSQSFGRDPEQSAFHMAAFV